MIKAELKERWGMYCDTDKLVMDMMELLTKYHHGCTEVGVCSLLDTYFTNKKELIDLFAQSSNYIGDMRICLDVELARQSDNSEVSNFCNTFVSRVGAETAILKYKDENGKTLQDYSRVGVRRFKARQLHRGNIANMISQNVSNRDKFRSDGTTKQSYIDYDKFVNVICGFKYSPTSSLTTSTIDFLTHYNINGRFVAGMKTSRAFNRVCSLYGVDRLPNYNKLFAEYADMVSGLKRKVKFYISLNPLDYLTMSFGNSWASCHTIDKKNERGMPNNYQGMYCGGTLSYMLDHVSIITYVHNHAMENHEDGKIYRNMFHYNGGTLIQGRIYPQGNDGATDLYKEFRGIMQDELSRLLNLDPNEWVKRNCGCGENTASYGVHYYDYLNFRECNVSFAAGIPGSRHNVVHIGHKRICPNCGYEVSDGEDSGWLTHEDCDNPYDDE